MQEQWIYGIHAVTNVLNRSFGQVIKILWQDDRNDKRLQPILNLIHQHNLTVEYVSRQYLDQLFNHGVHQGIAVKFAGQKNYSENDLEKILDQLTEPAFLMILDGVQDPHNLGACLRTADAAGVHAVIIPKDRAASLTPTARKAASGAAETIPFIQVTNLARVMRSLKEMNIWLYGMTEESETSIYAADLTKPIALIFGAEEKGMRRLTREHCDAIFSLPMSGTVSSLNVSVAAGVTLYEAVRQRRK